MTELTRRYVIMTLATEAPFDPADADAAFVLKPWKDPAALRALAAYRDHCYPELARDLDAWIRVIEQGPVVRGGVGARNEPYVRRAGGPARGGRSRPRAKTTRTERGGHPRPKTSARRAAAKSHRKKRRR